MRSPASLATLVLAALPTTVLFLSPSAFAAPTPVLPPLSHQIEKHQYEGVLGPSMSLDFLELPETVEKTAAPVAPVAPALTAPVAPVAPALVAPVAPVAPVNMAPRADPHPPRRRSLFPLFLRPNNSFSLEKPLEDEEGEVMLSPAALRPLPVEMAAYRAFLAAGGHGVQPRPALSGDGAGEADESLLGEGLEKLVSGRETEMVLGRS